MRKQRVRRGPGGRGERGAATVLVLAMAGVLLVVALAVALAEGLVVGHRRAQAAADLAALAGAGAAARGEDPCAAAGAVSVANGAALTACSTVGGDVTVEVRVAVAVPALVGGEAELTGRARAGPGG